MNELSEFFRGDENRGWLRTIGGILITVGLLLVWIRRGAGAYQGGWGEGALFLVLLITFAFLYGTGMALRSRVGPPYGWQAAALIFGVIVLVPTLTAFVDWIGGSPGADLNQAWIFLAAAAAATAAAVVAGVRYGLLLAGVALIFAWTNLWDEILSGGLGSHLGVTRGLFMIIAIVLLVAAAAVRFGPAAIDRIRASELVTAAGLAVLIGAGLLSLTSFLSVAAAAPTSGLFGSLLQGASLPVANPTWFWDLVLLSSSVLLIAFAARFAVRGPGYIGGIGIVVFVFLEGFDVDALLKAIREGATSPPGGELIWWPLLLILVGLAAFVASFGGAGTMAERLRGGPAPAPPPPSAPQPPPSVGETAVSPQPPPAPPPTEESPGPG